ncbi:helix-turn-helix domain-containing protein [Lactococcus sp.]|uniref:AraC family transcriptional regulator n=1 Tax=Lactococcus sp. TaxID=44273 RepID=UPI0035AFBF51
MRNELETIQHVKMNNLNFLLLDMSYRRPHLHFEMELAFVLEGSGKVITQEKEFELRVGQAIVFNSCQVHEYSSPASMKLLIMQFGTSIFDLIYPRLDEILFDSKPFNLLEHREILSFLIKTATTYFDENTYTPLKTYGYASLTLDQLVQICDYTLLNTSQQNKQIDLQERIERITKYLHEHYTEKIILEDIAAREGLSRTYFSHFFKNNFGVTFKEYLDYLRCERARVLLTTTNENLLTISYSCGFSDIRTLNNAFKKLYGSLPREYRLIPNHSINNLTQSNSDLIDKQFIYDVKDCHSYLEDYLSEQLL